MMDRRSFASDADYLRAHREAFCLAQELGCTPKEAEIELRRRKAREAHAQTTQRLEAKMNAAPRPASIAAEWSAPWMMRD